MTTPAWPVRLLLLLLLSSFACLGRLFFQTAECFVLRANLLFQNSSSSICIVLTICLGSFEVPSLMKQSNSCKASYRNGKRGIVPEGLLKSTGHAACRAGSGARAGHPGGARWGGER